MDGGQGLEQVEEIGRRHIPTSPGSRQRNQQIKKATAPFFLPQKNIYQTYVYIYNYIYYIELAFCSRHRVKRASLPRKNTASDPFQVVKMGLSEHAAYSYSKVIFFWEPLTIKHWIWMDSGSETPRNARMEPSHVQIQD